jgi:serine/threonine protein phosphatase PrpC
MSVPVSVAQAAPGRKPRDDEIDVYGVTNKGLVRRDNQDHFLVCSLRKELVVHHTSLSDMSQLPAAAERLAFVAMVADGVGGGTRGEEAARLAVETVCRPGSRREGDGHHAHPPARRLAARLPPSGG